MIYFWAHSTHSLDINLNDKVTSWTLVSSMQVQLSEYIGLCKSKVAYLEMG